MTLWVTLFVTFFPIWHPYAWMIHVSVWVIVAFARAVTVTILRTSSITCRTNENIQYQSGWTISYDVKKKTENIQCFIQQSGWTISHDVIKREVSSDIYKGVVELYHTMWKKKYITGIRFKRHDGTTILPLVKNYLNLTLSFLPSSRKPLKNVKIW